MIEDQVFEVWTTKTFA